MKTYLRSFLIFSVIIAVVVAIVSYYLQFSFLWPVFAYFLIITIAFHYGLYRSTAGKPQVFVRYFMVATAFKLFLHLIVVVGYSMLNKEQAFQFVISFFVLYLLFTIFEVQQAMLIAKK